jgi:hypothetical protein
MRAPVFTPESSRTGRGMFCLIYLRRTCEAGSRGSASLPRGTLIRILKRIGEWLGLQYE